jgi:hypothetical protein
MAANYAFRVTFAVAVLIFGSTFSGTAADAAVRAVTTLEDQQEVLLTVYNGNFALVKDKRAIDSHSGEFDLVFEDVAATVDTTSVYLKAPKRPDDLVVLEQNYQYDLVSKDKLLEKFIDSELTLVQDDGSRIKGKLLAIRDGMILDVDGEVHIAPPGRVVLPELPGGLMTRPTLLWKLWGGRTGPLDVEMSYLANNMTWEANYVAIVNTDDTALDLQAWVKLSNNSGTTFKNATLQLVAGDVNRVQPQAPYGNARADMMYAGASHQAQMTEEQLFEYHLYSLERKTTVRNAETKQITMLEASDAGANKIFLYAPQGGYVGPYSRYYRHGDTSKVKVLLEVENSEERGLGIPLPKGKVRVYKKDSRGQLQFIGEDSIDHTPKNEKVRLLMGNAFDLVGERKQLNSRKLSDRVWEYDVQIRLRNHKEETVTITALESGGGGDWKVLASTHEYTREDQNTLRFDVTLEPEEEQVINFTIRRNN